MSQPRTIRPVIEHISAQIVGDATGTGTTSTLNLSRPGDEGKLCEQADTFAERQVSLPLIQRRQHLRCIYPPPMVTHLTTDVPGTLRLRPR